MSTRSMIGKINPDGSVTAIYCHWDGYPENQLPILVPCYSNEEKLNELIPLGSISYLEDNPNPPEGMTHTFHDPHPRTVVAYHRDRGDKWEECKPDTYSSLDEMFDDKNNWNIEYYYLFDGDKWNLYDRDHLQYWFGCRNGEWWYLTKSVHEIEPLVDNDTLTYLY